MTLIPNAGTYLCASIAARGRSCPTFYNFYFFLSQSIQLIHKIINLLICGIYLALEDGFVVGGSG